LFNREAILNLLIPIGIFVVGLAVTIVWSFWR